MNIEDKIKYLENLKPGTKVRLTTPEQVQMIKDYIEYEYENQGFTTIEINNKYTEMKKLDKERLKIIFK